MPFFNNEILIYINENYGDPTLSIQGEYGVIDGMTYFTQANYRPINFVTDAFTGTIDGMTYFTQANYRSLL